MSERLIISTPFYITEPNTKCGYCHGKKPDEENYSLESWTRSYRTNNRNAGFENCTLGFHTESMSVEMYDKWCNMGFRRSGKFLYKTDILRNCCRLYTIRTTPNHLKLSKELKTTIRRFKKRINDESGYHEHLRKKNSKETSDYLNEIIEAERSSINFRTSFEPAIFTKEKYKLFVKYQEKVHQDHANTERSFRNFLCDSPFSEETIIGTQEEWNQLNSWKNLKKTDKLKRLGPAHECYYFNDNLVAVAVVDFLPSGISSVYFIWDPDFHKWSLGKLSALRELCITKRINRDYYYMGYYIEDCPKMAYKAKYGGELLDVCQHEYVPLMNLKQTVDLQRLFDIRDGSSANISSECQLNDKLSRPAPSMVKNSGINIADLVYGFAANALTNANRSALKLSQLGIPYSEIKEKSIYKLKCEKKSISHTTDIPNVFPGLVPLSEILEMVQKGKINKLDCKLIIYDTNMGGIRPMSSFQEESPQVKKVICDIVRCIGLCNTIDALIII